jgi:hypothetical protein
VQYAPFNISICGKINFGHLRWCLNLFKLISRRMRTYPGRIHHKIVENFHRDFDSKINSPWALPTAQETRTSPNLSVDAS